MSGNTTENMATAPDVAPKTPDAAPDAAPKDPVLKSWMRYGALVLDEVSDTMLGGKALGLDTDIEIMLCVSLPPDGSPWMGFALRIPLGSTNEDDGIGMRYTSKNLVFISSRTLNLLWYLKLTSGFLS